jgi:SAM-dependent methyltransferase
MGPGRLRLPGPRLPSLYDAAVAPALSLHAWLRYDAILRQLRRATDVRSVLEIGAGQGAVGVMLARRYAYTGLELDPTSFATARSRFDQAGVRGMVEGDVAALAPDVAFDLVCAFEVLEHIEDDAGAITAWSTKTRPGGWLLVSVPAGSHRLGPADRKAGHFRRYDRDDVSELFAAAGLVDASLITYGFPAGYVLEAGRNLLARRLETADSMSARTAASGRWLQPPDWAALATHALAAPLRLAQRPFGGTRLGTGLVALARRSA